MFGSIKNCHNTKDFRKLAKQRLPGPIFHYIDGAADDEILINVILKLIIPVILFQMY